MDQLQAKIKSYKKQIEEAEEIAALNLAKYRQVSQLLTTIDMSCFSLGLPNMCSCAIQVQSHLGESGERADINEQALAKAKVSARAASMEPF